MRVDGPEVAPWIHLEVIGDGIRVDMIRRIFQTAATAALAATAIVGLAFATGAQSATITGGNAVIPGTNYDSYSNFSILDGNNPISAAGDLTSWSIYAHADASAVELLIYQVSGQGYSLVGHSALETPAPAEGVQTFSLPGGLAV